MKLKELLRTFKKKIVSDLAAKAAVTSITVSASALFAVSLVYHIMMKDPPIFTMLILAAALFAICFAVGLVLSMRISEKQVALKIDELGLCDRILTMVEYEDDNSILADFQRKDAIIHLKSVKPSQLKGAVTKGRLAVCACSVLVAFVMCLLPYEVAYAEKAPTTDRAEQISEIMDELRDEYTPGLDEELKDKIENILDKTEQELLQRPNADNDSEIINDAIEEIEETINGGAGDSPSNGDGDVQNNKPPEKDPSNSPSNDSSMGGNGNDNNSEGSSLGSGSASSSNGNGDIDHDYSMTEPIYDPGKGTVTYGEIYVFYYDDYLRALKNGRIPEDMQEAVSDYFEALARK